MADKLPSLGRRPLKSQTHIYETYSLNLETVPKPINQNLNRTADITSNAAPIKPPKASFHKMIGFLNNCRLLTDTLLLHLLCRLYIRFGFAFDWSTFHIFFF
jgi:hypothetical protein